MKDLLFEGIEDLIAGLGIPLLFATGAAVFHVVFGGWKGLRHFLSLWIAGATVSVLTYWGCQHYGISGPAMAVVIGSAALFAYMIMSVLFHQEIKEALTKRIKIEILTRGRAKGRLHDPD